VRPEGLGKLKKLFYLMGSRTRYLPACTIVPQPLRYSVPHITTTTNNNNNAKILCVKGAVFCHVTLYSHVVPS
jgi:hypothetical protein